MTPDEVLQRVQANGTSLIRFLFCDNCNSVRGKAVTAAQLANFLEAGIGISVALQGFTLTDRVATDASVGPAGEVRLVPDTDTFVTLPYAPRQAAMLCDLVTLSGEPWDLDPRSALRRMTQAAAADGFEVMVGFEHEFYLATRTADGFAAFDDSSYGATQGMNSAGAVILQLVDALQAQGLQPVQYHPELGPGQQELSIHHTSALRAADNAVLTRETIRGVSQQNGLVASVAPKPFPMQVGNGSHIHLSLWREGRNAFYDSADPLGLSGTAYGFIAGLLQHLPGLLALTCPSVNSYRRLAPGMWSSAYICYGPDNREAAVRIASPFRGRVEASTNIELKAIDGSANPYLALAGVIAAGLDGVKRGLHPGEAISTNPSALSDEQRAALGIRRFPTNLMDACAALESDSTLSAALGPHLTSEFLAVRRSEAEDLRQLSLEEETKRHFARY